MALPFISASASQVLLLPDFVNWFVCEQNGLCMNFMKFSEEVCLVTRHNVNILAVVWSLQFAVGENMKLVCVLTHQSGFPLLDIIYLDNGICQP